MSFQAPRCNSTVGAWGLGLIAAIAATNSTGEAGVASDRGWSSSDATAPPALATTSLECSTKKISTRAIATWAFCQGPATVCVGNKLSTSHSVSTPRLLLPCRNHQSHRPSGFGTSGRPSACHGGVNSSSVSTESSLRVQSYPPLALHPTIPEIPIPPPPHPHQPPY
jgi:hypothetical protein